MRKLTRTPKQLTPLSKVQCYGCGWKGMLAEAKQSIWLSPDPRYFVPAQEGGNGKIWRCPQCTQKIFYTGYDHNRKIIAPAGHQYRNVI